MSSSLLKRHDYHPSSFVIVVSWSSIKQQMIVFHLVHTNFAYMYLWSLNNHGIYCCVSALTPIPNATVAIKNPSTTVNDLRILSLTNVEVQAVYISQRWFRTISSELGGPYIAMCWSNWEARREYTSSQEGYVGQNTTSMEFWFLAGSGHLGKLSQGH